MKIITKIFNGMRRSFFPTWFWLCITWIAILVLTILGPAEQSLGTHIRVVYLHGAWVWAAIVLFFVSAVCAVIGFMTDRNSFHCWSGACGRTGLLLWITYLPLSLWAMQTNWNGLFLAEPRWRLALVFAVGGLMLQIGLSLADKPKLTSAMNVLFLTSLILAIMKTPNVMHPSSPILGSTAWRIQIYFAGLVILMLIAAWQIARWWFKREQYCTAQ